jgi:hypothetical protein
VHAHVLASFAGGLSTGPDLDLCMLDVLLRHSGDRLAVLAKIMECATQSPGSIAQLLHALTLDGSHLTATIAESLLQQVCPERKWQEQPGLQYRVA